jgi:hypothetical protein
MACRVYAKTEHQRSAGKYFSEPLTINNLFHQQPLPLRSYSELLVKYTGDTKVTKVLEGSNRCQSSLEDMSRLIEQRNKDQEYF